MKLNNVLRAKGNNIKKELAKLDISKRDKDVSYGLLNKKNESNGGGGASVEDDAIYITGEAAGNIENEALAEAITMFCTNCIYKRYNIISGTVSPFLYNNDDSSYKLIAIKINLNQRIIINKKAFETDTHIEVNNLKELYEFFMKLANETATYEEALSAVPKITEEEYYNLAKQ